MSTETENETRLRSELAQANFRRALVEAGVAPGLAAHVASTATYSTFTGGVLIEAGEGRATDTPESLAALASALLRGAPDGSAGPVDDAGANEAARRAGMAAAEATKKATAAAELAFK